MCKKKVGKYRNDRGSTLIEIIVSVLIVGIVFVPLLIGLDTALKANRTSESELYADTVASNCLEVVKTFSLSGLKKQAENGTVTTPDTIEGMDAYVTVKGPVTLPEMSSTAKLTQTQSPTSADTFLITGIKEGTSGHTYYAKISFDGSPYLGNGKQNDHTGYSTVSDITDGKTVELNMAGNYDEEMYKSLKEIAQDHTSQTFADDKVKKFIKEKKTTVTIGQVKSGDPEYSKRPNYFYVKSKIEYVCNNILDAVGGSKKFDDAAGDDYTISYPETTQYYRDCPSGILLYYSVLGDIEEVNKDCGNNKDGSVKINGNTLVIDRTNLPNDETGVEREFTIYAICSGDTKLGEQFTTVKPHINSTLDVELKGASSTAEKTKISSTFNLANKTVGTGVFQDLGKGIVSPASANDIKKMYDVNIEIYDEKNNLLAKKTSSVVD